ncbi:MAG: glycine cleavage system protein GcvH [Planctomycetota bacterium]|jgi:glycine cleavage system H protein|nr:glycine cleavage system protein GcvH [Planctomycetota bacterium]
MTKVIDANNIRYTKRHEWVLLEDEIATIGLTDRARSEMGEITLVELPAAEVEFQAGDEAATLESKKDSLVVLAPLDGVVTEVNQLLEETPELINSDPYGDGWLFRLELTDIGPWNDLMTAEEYEIYADR